MMPDPGNDATCKGGKYSKEEACVVFEVKETKTECESDEKKYIGKGDNHESCYTACASNSNCDFATFDSESGICCNKNKNSERTAPTAADSNTATPTQKMVDILQHKVENPLSENLNNCYERCVLRRKAFKAMTDSSNLQSIYTSLEQLKKATAEVYNELSDSLAPMGDSLLESIFHDSLGEFQLLGAYWNRTLGNEDNLAVTFSATASIALDPEQEKDQKKRKRRESGKGVLG
jgi:hypothetical protein